MDLEEILDNIEAAAAAANPSLPANKKCLERLAVHNKSKEAGVKRAVTCEIEEVIDTGDVKSNSLLQRTKTQDVEIPDILSRFVKPRLCPPKWSVYSQLLKSFCGRLLSIGKEVRNLPDPCWQLGWRCTSCSAAMFAQMSQVIRSVYSQGLKTFCGLKSIGKEVRNLPNRCSQFGLRCTSCSVAISYEYIFDSFKRIFCKQTECPSVAEINSMSVASSKVVELGDLGTAFGSPFLIEPTDNDLECNSQSNCSTGPTLRGNGADYEASDTRSDASTASTRKSTLGHSSRFRTLACQSEQDVDDSQKFIKLLTLRKPRDWSVGSSSSGSP